MRLLGRAARKAARALALSSGATRDKALHAGAAALRAHMADILAANAQDVADAVARGTAGSFIDRLTLNEARVEAMARGLEEIAALPDPIGKVLAAFERPNGLKIERVATPLGVVGVIYESRPNVTADAGGLCLKAGNVAILRGGSESFRSTQAIHACLIEGLRAAGLPEAAISLVPTRDRAAVGFMLAGLDGAIDVIVPRGGKSLVARVQHEARVPVFAHLEGIVHIFIDRAADLDKAKSIVMNAKLRRTGICGAAETLLVDRAVAATHLAPLVKMLLDADCEVRGDAAVQAVDARVKGATEEDWRTEYLDAIISAKVVDGIDAAIDHIESYGSHHTDCIVTENGATAERFLNEVNSAAVYVNASTRFTDGEEFGFGAEIGISTQKLHARGPMG
ncbi:MAG TPA: glutamate-5-semialdehyde dehydrogenase, partial [Rhodoblastus sp.]|nr:glutamate-5-semialdehyde dehydrogenase [Rhodoblastus sp.]